DRQEYLGYVPSLWVKQMALKLENILPKENMKLANRKKNFDIDETAYISPAAILEGNVRIAEHVKIEAGAILIGDIEVGPYTYIALNAVIKGPVSIGDATHIYDNTLIDGARGPDVDVRLDGAYERMKVGSRAWINHGCSIRGTWVEDEGAVNIAAACDYGTRVGKDAIVANASATRINQYIAENCFAEGVPAVIKNHNITDEDRQDYFGLIPRVWGDFAKNWMGRTDLPRETYRNLNIHENAYVHPKAWLEGNITVGEYSWINAGTCLNGDITIGKYTNIECNCSIRGGTKIGSFTHIYDQVCIESGRPGGRVGSVSCEQPDKTVIGDHVWINHGSTMHGTSIEDGGAVNIGACCDYNTHIGKGAIVGNHSSTNVNTVIQN
ncbi:MAG TPA: hypothetical protein PLZ84_09220, partial [Clostridia bacterium]|nr:hypothetical protein [Clostridia bacterium]